MINCRAQRMQVLDLALFSFLVKTVDLTKTKRASTLLCTTLLAQKISMAGTIGGSPVTERERVAFQWSEKEVKLFSSELTPL